MPLIDKISVRQNWGEKYTFEKEVEQDVELVDTSEWSSEWLAQQIEAGLPCLGRGPSTNTPRAVTGEAYIKFVSDNFATKQEALEAIKNSIYCYFGTRTFFVDSRVYWRKKPEVRGGSGHYHIYTRVLISDLEPKNTHTGQGQTP